MRYVVACALALVLVLQAGRADAAEPYHTTKAGFGAYFLLMGVSRALEFTEATGGEGQGRYDLDPGGGFGLFGEFLVSPSVALGGEFVFAFPDVDDVQTRYKLSGGSWSDWSNWSHCGNCDNGVLFQMSFRARFPISVHPWVRIYPLVSVGLGTYTARFTEVLGTTIENENWVGLGWSAGFGVEVSTPVMVTPFMEIRYLGGVGGNTDKDDEVDRDTLVLNSLTFVLIGVRVM